MNEKTMKTIWMAVLCVAAMHAGCGGSVDSTPAGPSPAQIQADVTAIVQAYEEAANAADWDAYAALFWKDDPRFSEIEDHIAEPFGRKTFEWLVDWCRKNAKAGNNMRFEKVVVHALSDAVAYATAIQVMPSSNGRSRVTLIATRQGKEWRFIHGHFSAAPKED